MCGVMRCGTGQRGRQLRHRCSLASREQLGFIRCSDAMKKKNIVTCLSVLSLSPPSFTFTLSLSTLEAVIQYLVVEDGLRQVFTTKALFIYLKVRRGYGDILEHLVFMECCGFRIRCLTWSHEIGHAAVLFWASLG